MTRLQHTFVIIAILILLILGGGVTETRAENTALEPTVTQLTLNNTKTLSLEIIQWPDGSFSLPVKYFCEIVDITPHQSQQTSSIMFTSPGAAEQVTVNVESQTIRDGETTYKEFAHPIVQFADGFFSKNDLYIDKALLEKLLNIQITMEESSQTVMVQIDRPIKLLLQNVQNTAAGLKKKEIKIAHEPEEQGYLFEALDLNFNSSVYKEAQQQSVFSDANSLNTQILNMGSSLSTSLKGHLLDMDYEITPMWLYGQNELGLSDVQWRLFRKDRNLQTTIGTTATGLMPLVAPALPLWGISSGTENALAPQITSSGKRQFKGKATGNGKISLMLDDKTLQSKTPENHRYTFDPIELVPDSDNPVRIVQEQEDGTTLTLREESIAYRNNILLKGEAAYSAFLGRAPFLFRPPGMTVKGGNNGIFLPQSNKWMTGARYFYGLTDKVTVGIGAAADHIFGQPQSNPLNRLLYSLQNPDLSGYSSYYRDPNFTNGMSLGGEVVYRPNRAWSFSADIAHSLQTPVQDALLPNTDNLAGLAASMEARYQGENFQAFTRLFRYDTDYYTPTAGAGGTLYDRQGFSTDVSGEFKRILYQGGWSHYMTNLSSRLPGGTIGVDQWHGSLFRRLTPTTDALASVFWLGGQNETHILNNQNVQLEVNQQLPWRMLLSLAYRRTTNSFLFNPQNPLELVSVTTNNTVINTLLQPSLTFPLPKNMGRLKLGGTLSQNLNLVNLQGDIQWKQWHIMPLLQTALASSQKMLNLGLGLYYESKNGRRYGFRYTYNISSLPSITNFNVIGESKRAVHQIQFDFTDTLAILGHKLKSIGQNGKRNGMITGCVFLDLNRNGQRDEQEPPLPNIGLNIDEKESLKTNKKGEYALLSVRPGVHWVNYDYQTLSVNMTPTSEIGASKVIAGKRTRVDLGVIVTPGNLGGVVKLKDASNGEKLNPVDIIVVLTDKDGKRLQYTYTDSEGHYALESVPPGTYKISIDENQSKTNHYKDVSPEHWVTVPIEYNQFYDKMDIDFDVLELMHHPTNS